MKIKVFALLCALLPFGSVQSQGNTANFTFLQNAGEVGINTNMFEYARMYTARVNTISASQWSFGQVGTILRIMCIDPTNVIGNGFVWNARVNYLSNANYKVMRRGHLPDAESRYKRAAYLFTKLPATTILETTQIANTIYFILGERGFVPDTTVLKNANAWYASGAAGIDWNQVGVFTDVTTLLVGIGDTLPPKGGTQEFMSFANRQIPVTLNWVKGKQLLIVADSTKTPLNENATIKFSGYARTSAGVAVAAPLITWRLSDTTLASLQTLTGSTVLVKAASSLSKTGIEWLVGTWSTKSGIFRDSANFTITPTSAFLPWQPKQQVLTTRSTDADLLPIMGGSVNSVVLTTYVRTTAGVVVVNPKIVYTSSSPMLSVVPINNTSAQIVLNIPQNVPAGGIPTRTPVIITATWKTLSGSLASKTTIYYVTY